MKDTFIAAIHAKKVTNLTFFSKEDGHNLTRVCYPMDFGPSRRKGATGEDLYHVWDVSSDEGAHSLSLPPDQIRKVEVTNATFDPVTFVTWPPRWFVKRDWGSKS